MIRDSQGLMNLDAHQISYAAGSSSLDPYGFRVLDRSDSQRLPELLAVFPRLASTLNPGSLIVSAYPASLGLSGFAPFIDTYLHPPTFIRAMRLAARERRSVVLAAQPIAGADLLLRAVRANFEMPQKMLWASGGYYFPQSLESFIRQQLGTRDCELEVLHSYGVAEVAHTCFAATERRSSGEPKYMHVASNVNAFIDSQSGELNLQRTGSRPCANGDRARKVGNHWLIHSGRLCQAVRSVLESWSPSQWLCRTGYLLAGEKALVFQRREWVESSDEPSERSYFQFWEQFGGSMQSKPQWSSSRVKRPPRLSSVSPQRA